MKPNHERLLLRYIVALDEGDFETISHVCELAINDPVLANSIIEINLESGEGNLTAIPVNPEVIDQRSNSTVPNSVFKPLAKLPAVRWIAAAVMIVMLGGMLMIINQPNENPAGSSPSSTPALSPTPSVTPFHNPFEPTHDYETTKPILDNGKGSIQFKYPDNFMVRQTFLGIFIETNLFEGLKITISTGQSFQTSRITHGLSAESTYQDYQTELLAHFQRVNDASLESINIADYTINGYRVTEYSYQPYRAKKIFMLIEHPSGDPIIVEIYQPTQTTSNLIYDIVLAMVSTIEYDASSFTTVSYTDIAEKTLQVDFSNNVRQQIEFDAQQYGISYPFIAEAGAQKLVSIHFHDNIDDYNYAIQPSIFLLDSNGQPLDYIDGPTSINTLLATMTIPADGAYTLLVMPRTNGLDEGANTGAEYIIEVTDIQYISGDEPSTWSVNLQQPTLALRHEVDVYDEWTITDVNRSNPNSSNEIIYIVSLDDTQILQEVSVIQTRTGEDMIEFYQSGWILVVISAEDTIIARGEPFEIDFEVTIFE